MENKIYDVLDRYKICLSADNISINNRLHSKCVERQDCQVVLRALKSLGFTDEEYENKHRTLDEEIIELTKKFKSNKDKISAIENYLNKISDPEYLNSEAEWIDKNYPLNYLM